MPSGKYVRTAEHRRKNADANRGKVRTPEQRKRISRGRRALFSQRPLSAAQYTSLLNKLCRLTSEQRTEVVQELNKTRDEQPGPYSDMGGH